MKGQPVFVALEGGDGAGKSTQAVMLVAKMTSMGLDTTLVREPGTTPLGNHLREYLKSKRRLSPRAELLLFGAARAQLVEEIIRPSLEKGVSVVSDRFAASSIAYQGHGRGIAPERVGEINDFATQMLYPGINILLDVPPVTGLWRARGALERKAGAGEEDLRFEHEDREFHQRIREGYLAQATGDPERWSVIDATMSQESVRNAIWERVAAFLQ